MTQFCTFTLDGLLFGVDVDDVQEVLRPQVLTPVPTSDPVVSGLINLRGQIVTALDLRRRLELADRDPDRRPMTVVIRQERAPVSFLVDEIGAVIDVDLDTVERPPETLSGVARQLILGACQLPDRLLLLLDTDAAARPLTAAA